MYVLGGTGLACAGACSATTDCCIYVMSSRGRSMSPRSGCNTIWALAAPAWSPCTRGPMSGSKSRPKGRLQARWALTASKFKPNFEAKLNNLLVSLRGITRGDWVRMLKESTAPFSSERELYSISCRFEHIAYLGEHFWLCFNIGNAIKLHLS